jgi:hypothetical protein
VRVVPVEPRNTIEMIGKVGKQPGSSGEVGMSYTGWFHVYALQANGPRLSDAATQVKVAANTPSLGWSNNDERCGFEISDD